MLPLWLVQVPGSGVEGVCQIGSQPQVQVRFGSLDWIAGFLPQTPDLAAALHLRFSEDAARPSRAVAFIHVLPLESATSSAAAGGRRGGGTRAGTPVGDAVLFSCDDLHLEEELPSGNGTENSSGGQLSSRRGLDAPATAAVAAGVAGETAGASSTNKGGAQSATGSAAAAAAAGSGVGVGEQLAMMCFEDVIHAGVPLAVQQLQSGDWGSTWWGSGRSTGLKEVIMLTGKAPGGGRGGVAVTFVVIWYATLPSCLVLCN